MTTLALMALCCAGCSTAPGVSDGASSRQEHLVGKHPPGGTARILAHGVTRNRPWTLMAFTDAYGAKCVSIKYAGHEGIPACDIEVSAPRPMNAAIQQLDDHVAVVYGRVSERIEKLSARSAGRWERRTIHRDSSSGQRYFAVFIVDQEVGDIAGVTADGTRYSLKSSLDDFFSSIQS
ncbi:hypothetical protein ABZ770_06230 [Streptomyces sp. NPDC006654]|uniref:hypothetical protein n=1 Tax=unclassified Streptomyces TaxID=2593676 RepID=UPI0033DD6B33